MSVLLGDSNVSIVVKASVEPGLSIDGLINGLSDSGRFDRRCARQDFGRASCAAVPSGQLVRLYRAGRK